MTTFSIFTQPTSALRANSLAFNVIGDNISNSATPGYKAAETRFREQIIETDAGATASYAGVKPVVQHFIDRQGIVTGTGRTLDLAITGKGFFVTNTDLTASDGEFQLTRGGQFDLTVNSTGGTEEVILSDAGGNFVYGWPSDGAGGFSTGTTVSTLQPVRFDPNTLVLQPQATTAANLTANLQADAAVGTVFTTGVGIFDGIGTEQDATLTFTKTGINAWTVDLEITNSSLTTGVFPTTALTFDASGVMTPPVTLSPAGVVFTTGSGTSTNSFTIDLSGVTQFAGVSTIINTTRDGSVGGDLSSIRFTEDGVVEGVFSNGEASGIFKLPLANVISPNLMSLRANTHYVANSNSGEVELFEADQTGQGAFVPNSLENSTTAIDLDFARMIQNQQSYSSNVRAYTVAEEMIRTATNLKQ